MAAGKRWTRDELLVGINLYHKLRFGQLHTGTPAIVDLAEKLGRSVGSVAMKLNNFASLDPVLKLRGIKGLEGASALDRSIWTEFHTQPEVLVPESEAVLRKLFAVDDDNVVDVLPKIGVRVVARPNAGVTETLAQVKQRRGQEFFRVSVLNNFGGRCGVTGLAVRELLVASHIVPWGTHPEHRLNVCNGLSLSRLHDAAFDRGLITFSEDLRMVLSSRLSDFLGQKCVAENFGAYAEAPLELPDDAVLPDPELLALHRSGIFCKA